MYFTAVLPLVFPQNLGHFLKPHIFKTTMHDGKFETYLESKTWEIILISNLTQLGTHLYIDMSWKIWPHNAHYKHNLHLGAQVYKANFIAAEL